MVTLRETPMDASQDILISIIETAFAGVNLGDGISIRQADAVDDYKCERDQLQARKLDELDFWMNIPEADIEHFYWVLAFMDEKGLLFHIPAYMRFSVRHLYDSNAFSIDCTIYSLMHDHWKTMKLTVEQREAIVNFLVFMSERDDYADGTAAKKALKEVWS